MKVCFKLIQANSGSDIWTYNLASALQKLGVETEIQTFPKYLQYCPHLLRIWNQPTRSDIIHVNSWNGFAFHNNKIPLIVTAHLLVHDPAFTRHQSIRQRIFYFGVKYFEHRSFSLAKKITCVSNHTQKKLYEIFQAHAEVIHNGIDTNFFAPKNIPRNLYASTEGKVVLFYAGNLSKRKGVDLLPKITDKLGDNCILLCNAGLRSKGKFFHKNIIPIPRLCLKNLVNHYNLCDIFLFPSRLEGFGLTVCEAMACGKPIVTTNGSSLPELIIDGEGGFLCEKDNVNDFVEKIRILAESPDLRKRMGKFNRQRAVEHFSIERMAQKYYDLYQKILER